MYHLQVIFQFRFLPWLGEFLVEFTRELLGQDSSHVIITLHRSDVLLVVKLDRHQQAILRYELEGGVPDLEDILWSIVPNLELV